MSTKTYTRPSGQPITVNDNEETRALAASLNWKVKTKPKRKPKEQ